MNILAVIPARKGSKGVKDKNIKKINDVPNFIHNKVCNKIKALC